MLYDFQEKIYQDIKKALKEGHRNILICAPCGAGKSYVIKHILESLKPNIKALILCHRKELKTQHEELMPNHKFELPITAYNKLKKGEIGDENIIINDEVHLALADTWNSLLEYYKNKKAIILGFSATPERLDGKSFGTLFTKLITAPDVKWLIKNNFLSPYKYYCPQINNLDKLSTTARNNPEACMDEYTDMYKLKGVLGNVIKTYEKFLKNKKTIVYCINKAHAKNTAEAFINAGYKAISIDSDDTKTERKNLLSQFRNNEVEIICNCGLLSEGISIVDLEGVILLRPTSSYALFVQQSMRPLRKYKDKTAIIIDMVNNYMRHGLPDEKHNFDLNEGTKKRKNKEFDDEGNFTIRYCKNCFQAFKAKDKCPYCGFEYTLEPREIEEHKNIELAEIKEEQKRQKKVNKKNFDLELRKCNSEASAVELATKYGYNPYYGIIRFRYRRGINR